MAELEKTTIQLPAGQVLACREGDLISARGIPYAQASRFQQPQALGRWDDIKDCTQPAKICPQLPSRLESVMGPVTQGREMDENCLHLSVTAPAGAASAPVLVWLHGGAFISGGGDLDCYQPIELAKRGIVCVNVTYRLGVFGYLHIPDIAPANLGLLDQRTALQWIQTNIAAFGGDAKNITMVGQSAGADSIICLLAAEGTEGLIHRAILMSPPLRELRERVPTTALLSEKAQSLFTADPREMSVSELLAVQQKLLMSPVRPQIMLFAPSLNHYPLPDEKELDERISARVKDVPILIGWTEHDGRPFARIMGPLRTWYQTPIIGDYLESLGTWFVTSSYFESPSRKFHEQVLQAGGQSTTYHFGWYPKSNPLQANHCIDIPFVLGKWDAWKGAAMLDGSGNESEKDVQQVGNHLKNLWVGFAQGKTLQPRHLQIGKDFYLSSEAFS